MKSKNFEFQIATLRQDKIIFAVEAAAISMACLVVSSLSSLVASFGFIPTIYLFYGNIAIFVLSLGYTIYMLVSNFSRLKKIKKLEQEL
ncbi:MAG: hypothetical protein NTY75_05020 [Candidatus Shapirobacteria bacterium]|nr:hypothetical protein [Candidatus Shapirobacteria bacterium]